MRLDIQQKRKESVSLRKKGFSYGEIRKKVGIPKSTLSYWLKDVALKEADKKRLYTNKLKKLIDGQYSQKSRRIKESDRIIKLAQDQVSYLSDETIKMMGVALYWAEGTKGGLFEITNSDPMLVLFMVRWIKKVFDIDSRFLKARLNIYSAQDDGKIKNFWSRLCGIPLVNFTKSFIKPINKNYESKNLYYGTIKITIPKSTDLKLKVYGWLRASVSDLEKEKKINLGMWNQNLKKRQRPANV